MLPYSKNVCMPNVANGDQEIPELSAEWFRTAVRPLRRGPKRAVFVDEKIADRFESDDQLEQALRALLEATDHVKETG